MKPRLLVILFISFTIQLLSPMVLAQSNNNAKELYERGINLGTEGHFSEAKDVLTQGVSIASESMPLILSLRYANDVTSGLVPLDLGKLLFQSIDFVNHRQESKALEPAEQVTRMAPKYANGWVHLGTVHARLSQKAVTESLGKSYATEAIRAYNNALEIDPNSGIAHYNLGIAYAVTKQWKLAKDHLNMASSRGGIKVPSSITSEIDAKLSQEVKGSGGFFSGLFAPLKVLLSVFGGSDAVNAAVDNTWGKGSTSYRIGFVIGCIIFALIVGGGGSAAASKGQNK